MLTLSSWNLSYSVSTLFQSTITAVDIVFTLPIRSQFIILIQLVVLCQTALKLKSILAVILVPLTFSDNIKDHPTLDLLTLAKCSLIC